MSASSGKTADTIADTGVEAPTKRRPGRPRMKDSLPADPNDNSVSGNKSEPTAKRGAKKRANKFPLSPLYKIKARR